MAQKENGKVMTMPHFRGLRVRLSTFVSALKTFTISLFGNDRRFLFLAWLTPGIGDFPVLAFSADAAKSAAASDPVGGVWNG